MAVNVAPTQDEIDAAAETNRRVRLAALAAVNAASWKRPGCGVRCRETRAIELGSLRPIGYIEHDPIAHEEYGQLLATELMPSSRRGVVRTGGLTLDRDSLVVTVFGRQVALTARELQIVLVLTEHIGRVYTHRQILAAVWGPAYAVEEGRTTSDLPAESHLLRVNIARIRGKLGACGDLLKNQQGIGYVLRNVPPYGGA